MKLSIKMNYVLMELTRNNYFLFLSTDVINFYQYLLLETSDNGYTYGAAIFAIKFVASLGRNGAGTNIKTAFSLDSCPFRGI